MPTKLVLGLQHGDEGKGRVVDDLTETWADVVVRFQGGGNAGHTVYDREGNKFVTHILPVGVVQSRDSNKNVLNVISRGCVLNVSDLYEELLAFDSSKELTNNQLKISGFCPLIEPTHILIDRMKYQGKLGTTARGIGPAYSDFYARDSVLFKDFVMHPESSLNKIYKKFLDFQTDFAGQGGTNKQINDNFSFYNDWASKYRSAVDALSQYLMEDETEISQLYQSGKNILLEGAQGSGLSIGSNNYPDVTSSFPSVGGALNSTGLNHTQIDEVIGVIKSYKTKVGSGNFPSIISDKPAQILAEIGQEYGATTGRPRQCGWLDLDEVNLAIQNNGVSHLCIVKTDVMTHIEKPFVFHENKLTSIPKIGSVSLEDEGFKTLVNMVSDITNVNNISYTTGPKRGEIVWSTNDSKI